MPSKVSVIIPTHNRPHLIGKAVRSVLNQTYHDFEILVVDDGPEKRAEKEIKKFNDDRIRYIQHERERGGGAARNTGIKAAQGDFIAFLDDDDEWLPEKLEIQMKEFEHTSDDVGFCFTAVEIIKDGSKDISCVDDGVKDYYETSLSRFKGFITSTLLVKKNIFETAGLFDESLPSHQEAELIIRVTGKFRGLGINKSLVKMLMTSAHDHIGGNLAERIAGRELVLQKHRDEFGRRPKILAGHYFWLGLFCRDNKEYKKAKKYFWLAIKTKFKLRYLAHFLLMSVKRR